jgi:hypothetical protein
MVTTRPRQLHDSRCAFAGGQPVAMHEQGKAEDANEATKLGMIASGPKVTDHYAETKT